MKVAVVGATGRTGLECTKQLLEQGHSVSAICRSSAKAYDLFSCIPRPQRAHLNVCEVSNFEVEALKASLEGCEQLYLLLVEYHSWAYSVRTNGSFLKI